MILKELILSSGHDKIVDALIRHGANVNDPYNDGVTPLFRAAYNGNLKKPESI